MNESINIYCSTFTFSYCMHIMPEISSLKGQGLSHFAKGHFRWKKIKGLGENFEGAPRPSPGPDFIELLSTKTCLAWHFFLDKNRITNNISIWWLLPVTGIQLLLAYPEYHMEIWLENLVLWRQQFHAKHIFVLSSSMKLGPSHGGNGLSAYLSCFV